MFDTMIHLSPYGHIRSARVSACVCVAIIRTSLVRNKRMHGTYKCELIKC